MGGSTGQFVWYELMTTDINAAKEFYGNVVGWNALDSGMPGMEYWMFASKNGPLAGLMTLPDEVKAMGVPPHWMGYVGVADVDATAAKATELGGNVLVPPTDIPNMGRFAIFTDPHGAAIACYSSSTEEESGESKQNEEGHVGWHELNAGDMPSAFDFYAQLFGWEKKDALDMGPAGTYQMYGQGECTYGGMMTKPAEVPVPSWNYYFNVPGIEAAIEKVTGNGGQVLVGPMEVPGGSHIVIGLDPQGAAFALVGPK